MKLSAHGTWFAFLCAASCLSAPVGQDYGESTGLLRVGLRETAKHRPTLPSVRSLKGQEDMPGGEEAVLWLHVNQQGRVLEVRPTDPKNLLSTEVQAVARGIRYEPFTQNGVGVDAWVQDLLPLLPIEKKPNRVIRFPKTPRLSAVSIQLSRSQCYGSCPSYVVTLRGDGSVSYHGEAFVSIPGDHSGHVPIQSFVALLDQFRASNFLAFRNSYRTGWTDLPTYCLTVKTGSQVKVVKDYGGEWMGMPAAVTELEDAVDRVSDSGRWVTSSPGTIEAMQQAGIGFASPQASAILRTAVEVGDLFSAAQLLKAGVSGMQVADAEHSKPSLAEIAVQSTNRTARLEMLKLVLSESSIGTDSIGKQRALARAVEQGDVELAHALIEAGADPAARFTPEFAREDRDLTYLMLAAASGGWAMLDDALARRHDITAMDSEGRSALAWVLWNAPPEEDIFPVVDRLLKRGAKRSEINTALLHDCNPNWIPGLIARGANVNARDEKGNTPLFQFESCTVEGVRALLAAGADPGARNNSGKTAIEAATRSPIGRESPLVTVIRNFVAAHPH